MRNWWKEGAGAMAIESSPEGMVLGQDGRWTLACLDLASEPRRLWGRQVSASDMNKVVSKNASSELTEANVKTETLNCFGERKNDVKTNMWYFPVSQEELEMSSDTSQNEVHSNYHTVEFHIGTTENGFTSVGNFTMSREKTGLGTTKTVVHSVHPHSWMFAI